jgi:flagellar biosynthetic protein FliP
MKRIALLLGACLCLGALAAGQELVGSVDSAAEASAALQSAVPAAAGGVKLSTAVEIALLLTVLSLLPAILITLTSFTRIVIVLSFVRRSIAVNELPPNPVIIGLALFLTTFVMGPVFGRMYERAYAPYRADEIPIETAVANGWGELRGFLIANTRPSELDLFAELAHLEAPEEGVLARDALPFRVVVPAFVLSELKTAFQMGFLLFLPFLVIDLVVASVLISMGMFMLPPVMISTPFKILLFVLVDGWHLICQSLVTSFVTS